MSAVSPFSIFQRRETTAFIVALVVSALAYLAPRAGVAVPELAVGSVVAAVWSVFVGAVIEGRYKGVNYLGGLRELFFSMRFRLFLGTLAVWVIQAALVPFGVTVPDEAAAEFANFLIAAIYGKTAIDSVAVALKR